jgi:hypothetical protein
LYDLSFFPLLLTFYFLLLTFFFPAALAAFSLEEPWQTFPAMRAGLFEAVFVNKQDTAQQDNGEQGDADADNGVEDDAYHGFKV